MNPTLINALCFGISVLVVLFHIEKFLLKPQSLKIQIMNTLQKVSFVISAQNAIGATIPIPPGTVITVEKVDGEATVTFDPATFSGEITSAVAGVSHFKAATAGVPDLLFEVTVTEAGIANLVVTFGEPTLK